MRTAPPWLEHFPTWGIRFIRCLWGAGSQERRGPDGHWEACLEHSGARRGCTTQTYQGGQTLLGALGALTSIRGNYMSTALGLPGALIESFRIFSISEPEPPESRRMTAAIVVTVLCREWPDGSWGPAELGVWG